MLVLGAIANKFGDGRDLICKFVITQMFGNYLNIPGDITAHLCAGSCTLHQAELKLEACNEWLEENNIPVRMVSGVIDNLKVNVPLKVWKDSITTEVDNIHVAFRYIEQPEPEPETVPQPKPRPTSRAHSRRAQDRRRSPNLDDAERIRIELKNAMDSSPRTSQALDGLKSVVETIIGNLCAGCNKIAVTLLHETSDPEMELALTAVVTKVKYAHTEHELKNNYDDGTETETARERDNKPDAAVLHSANYKINFDSVQILLGECRKTDDPLAMIAESLPIMHVHGENSIELSHLIEKMGLQANNQTIKIALNDIRLLLTPRQTHLMRNIVQQTAVGWSKLKTTTAADDDCCEASDIEHSDAESDCDVFRSALSFHMNPSRQNVGAYSSWSAWSEPAIPEDAPSFAELRNDRQQRFQADDNESTYDESFDANYWLKGTDELRIECVVNKFSCALLYDDVLQSTAGVHDEAVLEPESFEQQLLAASAYLLEPEDEKEDADILFDMNGIYLRAKMLHAGIIVDANYNASRITVNTVEVRELVDGVVAPLILFVKDDKEGSMNRNMELELRCSKGAHKSIACDIKLQKFELDWDLTICDRISAYFGQAPYKPSSASKSDGQVLTENNSTSLSITLSSELANVNLRFAQLDLQDADGGWRRRRLHADYLVLALVKFRLGYNEDNKHVYIASHTAELHYKTEQEQQFGGVPIVQCWSAARNDYEEPRLPFIWLDFVSKPCDDLQYAQANKLYVRKHYTNKVEMMGETRSFTLPNTPAKLDEFCDNLFRSSSIQIRINSPHTRGILRNDPLMPDKTLEFLYNRINQSWLLWKPSSPHFKEPRQQQRRPFTAAKPKAKLNKLALQIELEKADVDIFLPVFDDEGETLPNLRGRLTAHGEGVKLFLAPEYYKAEHESYICVQVDNITAEHCGIVPSEPGTEDTAAFMRPLLYRNSGHYHVENSNSKERTRCLAVLVHIEKLPKNTQKRIDIVSCVSNMIIRHNPLEPQLWLMQLKEFFDWCDYDLDGYEPCSVITSIEAHFIDCAIEFREQSCAYRGFLTISSLAVSTAVSKDAERTDTRIVTDECSMLLGPNNKEQPDVKQPGNLIEVFQTALFDLCIMQAQPKRFDWRCSWNGVVLSVCSDSAGALSQLVQGCMLRHVTSSDSANAEGAYSDDEQQQPSSDPAEQREIQALMSDAVNSTIASVPKLLSPTQEMQETNSISACMYDALDIDETMFFNGEQLHPLMVDDHQKLQPEVEAELGDVYSYEELLKTEDDFIMVRNENAKHRYKEIIISDEPIEIIENHFAVDKKELQRSPWHLPKDYPVPECSFALCDFSIVCRFFGGNDFSKPKENNNKVGSGVGAAQPQPQPTQRKKRPRQMTGGYADHIPLAHTEQPRREYSAGGIGRKHNTMVEAEIKHLCYRCDFFAKTEVQSKRHVLLVRDIVVRDRVQSSAINKMFYHRQPKIKSKNSEYVAQIVLDFKRPKDTPRTKLEECVVSISLMPVRVNLQQSTLIYLDRFFASAIKEILDGITAAAESDDQGAAATAAAAAGGDADACSNSDCSSLPGTPTSCTSTMSSRSHSETPKTYFSEVKFGPEFSMRIDYEGSEFDSSKGVMFGLFMYLIKLKGSEVTIKEFVLKQGISGFEKLFDVLARKVFSEVAGQVPRILTGITPVRPLYEIGKGTAEFLFLPYVEYRRTGKLARGMLLGMQSFCNRSLYALLDIASGVIYLFQLHMNIALKGYGVQTLRSLHLNQFVAETTFEAIATTPTRRYRPRMEQHARRERKPRDFAEGLMYGAQHFREGASCHLLNLVESTQNGRDQFGLAGAVGAVAKQIPQTVVMPVMLSAQAISNVIDGAKNSLIPEARDEAMQKWKPPHE